MKMIIMNVALWRLGGWVGLAVILLCAACGTAGKPTTRPGQLNIVVAFYPFQFITERVAGSRATVNSLTAPGAEPHDIELTAQQVASVTEADLVVYERSFQPAVDDAVTQSGNAHVLDTASVVPLVPAERDGQGQPSEQGASGALDPHVWLDPDNMITIAQAVARQLAGIDPDHAQSYRHNAAVLEQQLTGLSAQYTSGLKRCQRREFITTHAAFGYLARHYGLLQTGISGLSPDTEPSPARIAAIQAEATAHQITTIFYETLVSPAVANSIANDLHLKTDVLDPIEGITEQSRGTDYIAVMQSNLKSLRAANGCG